MAIQRAPRPGTGAVSGRPELSDRAVTVPPHVLVREVADEVVILSLQSEEYFGLDPVGTRMLQLLRSEPSVQRAFDALSAEYDVDDTTLSRDLDLLLQELSSRHLIELSGPPVETQS